MTPHQHYIEAERLVIAAAKIASQVSLRDFDALIRLAGVHATLAIAKGSECQTATTEETPETARPGEDGCLSDLETG